MSHNKSKREGEEVFSSKVYELVITEPGVGGSYSNKHHGEEGGFGYNVRGCYLWQGRKMKSS